MENIDTLLAAAAQTQMLDGEETAVPTPTGVGLAENSELPAVVPGASVKMVMPPQPKKPRRVAGEKSKRGRACGKPPLSKRFKPEDEEEDVCFICFDGGSLVLCDCKGCPKAYHPACIKRDEAFFQSTAKWYCGWHICSVCRKASHYLCYTCSYSLCKGCAKDADYSCVRKNKGFCSICMKTIMLLENKGQANNETIQVDFDDITSWEYLFKAYWVTLKDKLSLTLDELTRAQNHLKDMGSVGCKPPPSNPIPNAFSLAIPISELLGTNKSRVDISLEKVDNKDTARPSMDEKNTDIPCIKEEAIHEPGKSLVNVSIEQDTEKKCICKNTHEKSVLVEEDSQKSSFIPVELVTAVIPAGLDGNSRKRKPYRKSSEKARTRNNLNEYAAIDVHNINLIYLKRDLMEKLIEDRENFNNMVIGSIVRIIVSSNDQKEDVHRLVQVAGTTKVDEPYKIGDKTADVKLEVLNLVRKEVVSIDAISDNEFTENECIRLRQSIRSGLVKQFTVGEVRTKAMALQPLRVNVCLEAEILQLNDLRDQANKNGSKKELRGIVSKLKRLESPAELRRRISKIPEIHTDPKMSPNYESEEETKCGDNGKTADHADTPQNGKKSISSNKKDKEQRITRAQSRVGENPDASGSSCSDKHTNQVVTINSVTDGGDIQPMQSSGLEASIATTSVGDSPSSSVIDTEKVWHYRDPSDNIQGPFAIMQLRKWSTTTRLFPDDMRVWRSDEQHDSLLLTDALIGKFKSVSDSSHSEAREEGATREICDEVTNVNGEDIKVTEGSNDTVSVHSEAREERATREICDEVRNVNGEDIKVMEGSNDTVSVPSENNSELVRADESSSWPQCWDSLKDNVDCNSDVTDVQPCELPQKSHEDLHHHDPPLDGEKDPTLVPEEKLIILSEPKLQNQSDNVEEKAIILSEPELQIQSDTTEKNLIIPSEPQLQIQPDIAGETLLFPSEPELQIQSNNAEENLIISSGPQLQIQSDTANHMDLPSEEKLMSLNFPPSSNNTECNSVLLDKSSENENINLLDLFGPTLDFDVTGDWCGYSPTPPQQPITNSALNEPMMIELDALSEEYMSDLLAEVDAMDFEGGPMPSPANFARELEDCRDSDCFSSIGEMSRRSDAFSCTSEPQCKPISHEILTRSSVQSSTSCDGETVNNGGSSEFHAGPSGQNAALDLVGPDNVDPGRSITMVQGNINLVTVQGNVNLVLGQGWETGQGTGWANPSPRNGGGNMQWEGQRMYGGDHREWGGYQGGRPQWGWQPQYGGGGGGGGYQRQIPKGKRVCKFFESGHCKKGAFCDYLHP